MPGILIATDFSVHAREAASAAIAIARRLDAPARLVHVAEPNVRLTKELRADLERSLAEEAARLQSDGAAVEPKLLEGNADEAIVAEAVRMAAELIVVAALGFRTEPRWRLGRVAERVVQTSPLPVWAVREPARLLAWCRGQRPLRVCVGDDSTPVSEPALGLLKTLRRVGPCEVTVVHVYWPSAEYARLGLYGASDLPAEIERVLSRELLERLARLGVEDFTLRLQLSYGRVADPLLGVARQEDADLLVLGTHQRARLERLWHGSVTHVCLHYAPVSLLCVPGAAESLRPAVVPAIRRVLAPTDLSEVSKRALPYAYALLPNGGEVVLLHVLEAATPLLLPVAVPGLLAQTANAEEAAARSRIEELVPADAAERRISTRVLVSASPDVPNGILQAAEREGSDVICMASRGRSGLKRLLMGSVAQRVVASSRRPVLIVHGA